LRLGRCVVDDGWTYTRAADRFQCSPATAKKWADRYRAGGPEAMNDKSTPHRVAAYLLPGSTAEAVLRRYQAPLLRDLDQARSLPARRTRAHRYEHPAPGDLIRVDIKKLARIPDWGGHRMLGRHSR